MSCHVSAASPWALLAHTLLRDLARIEACLEPPADAAAEAWLDPETRLPRPGAPNLLGLLAPEENEGHLLDPAEIAAAFGRGEDPFAVSLATGRARPPRRLRHTVALAAIRLSEALGSTAAFNAMADPSRITVIEVAEEDLLEPLARLLTQSPAAGRMGCERFMEQDRPRGTGPLVITPSARLRLDPETLTRSAILGDNPVIAMVRDSEEVKRLRADPACRVLSLPPLTGDGLLVHLGHTHSATFGLAFAELRRRMPPDADLAEVPMTDLLLALRQPTGFAVVDRLRHVCEEAHARCEAQPTGGLDSLAGYAPELIAEMKQIVTDLEEWKAGRLDWSAIPNGYLLSGPPGSGKTHLVRGLAQGGDFGFIATGHSEWQSAGHLGDTLKAMRASFQAARRAAPCILFLDEIDAFGRRDPNSETRNASYDRKLINGLLAELDGVAGREGVVVIGACNEPEALDAAITRPGRFDRRIELGLPNADGRSAILHEHLGLRCLDPEMRAIAAAAAGASGADIAGAVRTARAVARRERRAVTAADIRAALPDAAPVPYGVLRRIAVHETGHLLAGHLLGIATPVRISIGTQGGRFESDPVHHERRREDLEADLSMTLAGRAAERLVLGSVSAGAGGPEQSDLARATLLAVAMEVSFGLNDQGDPTWLGTPRQCLGALRHPALRRRVRERITVAEDRAKVLLARHRAVLVEISEALVLRREMDAAEIADWLAPLPGELRDGGDRRMEPGLEVGPVP